MTVEKVSLSLETGVVAEARAASGGNLSAFVNEALEARLRNRHLRQVLDEFEHEFPPDPEGEARVHAEFMAGLEKIEAANRELDDILVRGTGLLNEHPLVEEAVIAMGPLRTPVAYVVLVDEGHAVADAAAAIREVLARVARLWRIDIAVVSKSSARGGQPRSALSRVVPL